MYYHITACVLPPPPAHTIPRRPGMSMLPAVCISATCCTKSPAEGSLSSVPQGGGHMTVGQLPLESRSLVTPSVLYMWRGGQMCGGGDVGGEGKMGGRVQLVQGYLGMLCGHCIHLHVYVYTYTGTCTQLHAQKTIKQITTQTPNPPHTTRGDILLPNITHPTPPTSHMSHHGPQ